MIEVSRGVSRHRGQSAWARICRRMFVQSLRGISHNKIEDTKEEHLKLAVTAFDKLADKAMRWIG